MSALLTGVMLKNANSSGNSDFCIGGCDHSDWCS